MSPDEAGQSSYPDCEQREEGHKPLRGPLSRMWGLGVPALGRAPPLETSDTVDTVAQAARKDAVDFTASTDPNKKCPAGQQ